MLKDQFILLFVLSNGVTKEVFNMHLPLLCSINVLCSVLRPCELSSESRRELPVSMTFLGATRTYSRKGRCIMREDFCALFLPSSFKQDV